MDLYGASCPHVFVFTGTKPDQIFEEVWKHLKNDDPHVKDREDIGAMSDHQIKMWQERVMDIWRAWPMTEEESGERTA